MRLSRIITIASAAVVSMLVACSSSSSGSASFPTCQGSTGTSGQGSPACNSCVQSNCGSQVSSAEGSCSAYFNCFASCQCSDLNCVIGCQGKIDSTCQNAFGPLSTCISNSCASQCNSGGGVPEGGTD